MTVHPLISSTQRAARPLSLICDVAFGVPSLTIPDGYWMSAGDEPEDGAGDRLLCTVQVNGIDFLFDARSAEWESYSDGSRAQYLVGDELDDDLTRIEEFGGDPRPFTEMTIRGRQYLVLARPHVVEG